MNTSDLFGSWDLETFEIEDKEGNRKSWGENLKGLLIYSPCGRMSVGINKSIIESGDGWAEDCLDSVLFYSGTYQIHDSHIYHLVEVASDPDRIGKTLIRSAQLDSLRLRLTSPIETFGRAILTWKRRA
jgi:hypothetical protein